MCIRDRNPTMGVKEKPLFVPELIEAPGGKVDEDEITQEVVNDNETDLDQLIVYRSSVHNTKGVIPSKLAVERKTRIPGNLMFGSHETESVSYTHLDVYKRQQ